MRTTYTQLYLHCVWATWDRLPLIKPGIEERLYQAILKKAHDLRCEVISIGGMDDHMHVLVRIHPTVSVSEFIHEVKGASSHLMTHEIAPGEFFKWQGAYGAFTVGKDALPAVSAYIHEQKERHSRKEVMPDWEY